jgi:hypothetical protein
MPFRRFYPQPKSSLSVVVFTRFKAKILVLGVTVFVLWLAGSLSPRETVLTLFYFLLTKCLWGLWAKHCAVGNGFIVVHGKHCGAQHRPQIHRLKALWSGFIHYHAALNYLGSRPL